jgi:hypothetical protein
MHLDKAPSRLYYFTDPSIPWLGFQIDAGVIDHGKTYLAGFNLRVIYMNGLKRNY